jgi:hypothetical protein
MRNDHIISLLEENRLTGLGADKISVIEAHVSDCPDCLKAYTAARVAGAMLKARAAETFEPSPFFKTRVMAALKEKQSAVEPSALVRLWRAAGPLASLMALIVVVLFSLTLFSAGEPPTAGFESPPASVEFSILGSSNLAESLLFEEDAAFAGDEVTNAQALEAVFDAEDADGSY